MALDNVDNTSNLRVLYSDSSGSRNSYQWMYPTIFKNAVRISNVPFSDIITLSLSLSLHRSFSISRNTLSFRVLHIFSLYFPLSDIYSSFLFHTMKNDRSITLHFLDIRICYLRLGCVCVVRIFDFCLRVFRNGAFSYLYV